MIVARRRFLFLAPAIIAAPSLMKLSALHLPEPETISANEFRVVRAILDGMVKGRRPEDIADEVITLTTVHAEPPAKGERITIHGVEPSSIDGDYVVI